MRPSGRSPDELRPTSIQRNYTRHAEGSVLICCGDTHVLCTASVDERVPPFLRGKGEGWVTAEYAMLPCATPGRSTREVSRGRPSGRSSEIQRLIGRSLRAVLDLEALPEATLKGISRPVHAHELVAARAATSRVEALSESEEGEPGAGRVFGTVEEARMAYDHGDLGLHAPIKLRVGELAGDPEVHAELKGALDKLITEEPVDGSALLETTVGRAIMNDAFPASFPYVNNSVFKADVRTIIEETLLDVMYEIPSRSDVVKCVVNADTIRRNVRPLLLSQSDRPVPWEEELQETA